MFPDPTIKWTPYPSVIDGILRPFVFDGGVHRQELALVVCGDRKPGAFVVLFCALAYAGVEEMIYSTSDHGEGLVYSGDVFIKEAKRSAILDKLGEEVALAGWREPRHFALVSGHYCFDVLSNGPPKIREFASYEEAMAWTAHRDG